MMKLARACAGNESPPAEARDFKPEQNQRRES